MPRKQSNTYDMFTFIVVLFHLTLSSLGSPMNGRIVNGTDAKEGEIPYIVSLRYNNIHNCGGSILNHRYVLTAAHCVVGFQISTLSIQYGVTKVSFGVDAPNVIPISGYTYNNNFDHNKGNKNDVAIVELSFPIIFGPNVKPVKLAPAQYPTPASKQALVSGWGLNQSGGIIMKNLQKVNVTVYSDDECERIYAHDGPTNRDYHICAGVPEGGKGECTGDSGGPLMVDGFQVGIVSWSTKPCTTKGYPGVFTKVSTQVPWILIQMKER